MRELLRELQEKAARLDPDYDLSLAWGKFSQRWTAMLLFGTSRLLCQDHNPEVALQALKIKLLAKSEL